MRWRVALLLAIGLMYYGYVRENTDKAMTVFDSFKASYLTTIDQAAAGQIPTEPPTSLTVSN